MSDEHLVALRKESVDRNVYAQGQVAEKAVALRKESVDRNLKMQQRLIGGGRRSPQGERG